MEKIKVLLFAAKPRGTAPLDLPREFREIDEEVRLSTFRSAVELILVPGTRPVDLLRKLNENQPQVSDDRTVKYWDLVTNQPSRFSIGHDGPVSAVSVSADARHALSGSHDRTIRLSDVEQRICRAKITLDSPPRAIARRLTGSASWLVIDLATSINSKFISDSIVVQVPFAQGITGLGRSLRPSCLRIAQITPRFRKILADRA